MQGRGKFISFEGGEGSGKSTQILELCRRLEAKGIELCLVREPGGTPLGEALRGILKQGDYALCDASELLLFGAARAQLVRSVIEPALDEGRWVLADRFVDSTEVYQARVRGNPLDFTRQVNAFATEGLQPDLTFLIDLPAKLALNRIEKRAALDRIEAEGLAFHEAIREAYRALARENRQRIHVLDGQASIDTLNTLIWNECHKRFFSPT